MMINLFFSSFQKKKSISTIVYQQLLNESYKFNNRSNCITPSLDQQFTNKQVEKLLIKKEGLEQSNQMQSNDEDLNHQKNQLKKQHEIFLQQIQKNSTNLHNLPNHPSFNHLQQAAFLRLPDYYKFNSSSNIENHFKTVQLNNSINNSINSSMNSSKQSNQSFLNSSKSSSNHLINSCLETPDTDDQMSECSSQQYLINCDDCDDNYKSRCTSRQDYLNGLDQTTANKMPQILNHQTDHLATSNNGLTNSNNLKLDNNTTKKSKNSSKNPNDTTGKSRRARTAFTYDQLGWCFIKKELIFFRFEQKNNANF